MRSLKLPIIIRLMLRVLFGILKPRNIILGQEISGTVVDAGANVTKFKIGDEIFGATGFTFGGYGEYKCISEKGCYTIKPKNITFEEAAGASIGGLEARHYLKKFKVKANDEVIINGAGGSIGTLVLQICKSHGAKVTVVDSADKFEMLKSLGADEVIDFQKEDFTKANKQYDLIFDVVGKVAFGRGLSSLNKDGNYVIANPKGYHKFLGRIVRSFTSKNVYFDTSDYALDDLLYISKALEKETIKIYIDKVLTLEEIPQAHEYVEARKKLGNLIIRVSE